MYSETYTISTSQCLVTSAKRYRSSNRRVHAGTAGWVLIFAHGAGMFKERFEPLLRRLFELDQRKECGAQIVEAWTIDAQTHGAAADLNESVINKEKFCLTAFDYAGALAALRTSIFFGDADMQRVVLIGENEGSSTVLFTPDFFSPDDPLPIENIILINPFTSSPQFDIEAWRGRESARAYFRKRMDPVLADNFVNHALVRTDTGTVRMRASKRHRDQLRDKKYSNWESMAFPIGTGVHLVLTEPVEDLKSKLNGLHFTSVRQTEDLADALYGVLTEASRQVAERVFGVIRESGKL